MTYCYFITGNFHVITTHELHDLVCISLEHAHYPVTTFLPPYFHITPTHSGRGTYPHFQSVTNFTFRP